MAWYKFEGNFNDSSVNSNTGAPHGGIGFVPGVDGNTAIDLDGFGDYVSIARGDDSWRLARYQETGMLEFAASGLSGGAQPSFGNAIGTTRVNVNDDQWHHVAGVYDGSKVYLYIDGVLDSFEDASGIIDDSTYEVYIGENAENSDREWEGVIDEVRIYHEALPHAEIVDLAGESVIYQPVLSLANIYDEEAQYSKSVNFKDYAKMANNWLQLNLDALGLQP